MAEMLLEQYYFCDKFDKVILVNSERADHIDKVCGKNKDAYIDLRNVSIENGILRATTYSLRRGQEEHKYKLGSAHRDYQELQNIYMDKEKREKILTYWQVDNKGVFTAYRYIDSLEPDRNGVLRRIDSRKMPGINKITIANFYQTFSLGEDGWIHHQASRKDPNDHFNDEDYYVIWRDDISPIGCKYNLSTYNAESWMGLFCRPMFEKLKKI